MAIEETDEPVSETKENKVTEDTETVIEEPSKEDSKSFMTPFAVAPPGLGMIYKTCPTTTFTAGDAVTKNITGAIVSLSTENDFIKEVEKPEVDVLILIQPITISRGRQINRRVILDKK